MVKRQQTKRSGPRYFPQAWEAPLLEVLLTRYVHPRRRGKVRDLPAFCAQVAEDVARLTGRYNHERGSLTGRLFERAPMRAAYLAQWFPLNLARVVTILDEARTTLQRVWGAGPVRVLDLGSGPGSGALGAVAALPDTALELVCVDQAPQLLDDARALATALAPDIKLHIARGSLPRLPEQVTLHGRYQLVLLGNLLNELPNQRERVNLLHAVLTRTLDPLRGVVLVTEPATQEAARALATVRDELLSRTITVAPCLHDAPCPLLARRGRDWCYTERAWHPPAIVNILDDLTGLDHSHLRWSYWLLASETCTAAHPPAEPAARLGRVVSGVIPDGERSKLLHCRPAGLETIELGGGRRPAPVERGALWTPGT